MKRVLNVLLVVVLMAAVSTAPSGATQIDGPGYPSGTVITLTTTAGLPLSIETHRILDPEGAELAHVWHPKGSNGFMSSTWALYANDPLASQTTYTVVLTGRLAGSEWSQEWSFTTE